MYRLTLVKSWNTDEIRNYAELVKLGSPDFIEVKVRHITRRTTHLATHIQVSLFGK